MLSKFINHLTYYICIPNLLFTVSIILFVSLLSKCCVFITILGCKILGCNCVLSLLKEKDYQLYMITVITGCAGLRLGEALGLESTCISLKNKTIKIAKQVTFEKGKGYILSNRLKAENSYRTIPIIDFVAKELTEYLVYIKSYKKKCILVNTNFQNNTDLIFINNNGNLLPTNSVDRKWRQ